MMAVGWNGADPAQVADADDYALGTAYRANVDITISHLRIHAGAGEESQARTGKIWSSGGALITTVTLPNDLPTGWSLHPLDVPLERTAGTVFVVAYDTGGNYSFLNQGLNADVPSADAAVTALGFANAPNTINGRFNVTPGDFPAQGNAQHAFYGVDFQYTVGIAGNTAPVIQEATVTVAETLATATIVATDEETISGATYRYDWGDGSPVDSTNHPTTFKTHTYVNPGIYPVLLSVTDADGLSDFVARYALVQNIVEEGTTASDILDLLVARTKATKQIKTVMKHEPRSAPTVFPTAAFFLGAPNAAPGGFQTIKRVSSLNTAGMRLDVICRIYMDAKAPVAYAGRPPSLDNIDQVLLEYAEVILRECHAHVSFGIENSGIWTDADGADSDGLGGLIGYLDQDQTKFRIIEIYIPVILTDYFTQGNP